jgi:hypothetical protein
MKRCLFLLSGFLLAAQLVTAQTAEEKYGSKVQSLDSTLSTLYSVISGEKGEERNWELFRYLFHEEAKLIPSGKSKEGKIGARYMTAEDYIHSSGKWLVENGFFEKEISREVQQFGGMAHVFSTYAAYRSESDKAPFMRGINSIQLMYDGTRWWIINIYWTPETEEHPLPGQYLPKG